SDISLLLRPPPTRSTSFPYTTLFRSSEDRDRGLDGVFVLGVERACHAEVRGAFARAGAAALDADLPDDGCEQEDRAGLILAVGVALRTPALGDGAGLGLGDLACQLDDAVGWNPGDLRCPLWGLLDAVGAIAHDVGAVGGVFRRRVGQGVLVEADGVLVEELLVLEVLREHDV